MRDASGRKNKEDYERDMAREYLEFKGIHFTRLQTLAEFRPAHASEGIDGPDIFVTLLHDDTHHMTGIELTRYICRKNDHGSASLRLNDINDKLNTYVRTVLIPKARDLRGFSISMTLNLENLPRGQEICDIADGVVKFIDERRIEMDELVIEDSYTRRLPSVPFDGFPVLARFLKSLRIMRTELNDLAWKVSDATAIGLDDDIIVATIVEKSEKLAKYHVDDCDETWLLIAADGSGSDCRIGPPMERDRILENGKIVGAAQRSGFDKVIIWERVREWDAVIRGQTQT
ncbi:hypothetical protein RAS2_01630 [Phycisphaerae bacterium RAS2]|nr:hypothetical protein RAS2_01630 [Phycisphaerae bacterium RAS2]